MVVGWRADSDAVRLASCWRSPSPRHCSRSRCFWCLRHNHHRLILAAASIPSWIESVVIKLPVKSQCARRVVHGITYTNLARHHSVFRIRICIYPRRRLPWLPRPRPRPISPIVLHRHRALKWEHCVTINVTNWEHCATLTSPRLICLFCAFRSYKVNTAYGIVIFGKCDPLDGYSPCSSFMFGTVSAVDGLSTSFLQCILQSIWPL